MEMGENKRNLCDKLYPNQIKQRDPATSQGAIKDLYNENEAIYFFIHYFWSFSGVESWFCYLLKRISLAATV